MANIKGSVKVKIVDSADGGVRAFFVAPGRTAKHTRRRAIAKAAEYWGVDKKRLTAIT
jgi:hypothetical protein